MLQTAHENTNYQQTKHIGELETLFLQLELLCRKAVLSFLSHSDCVTPPFLPPLMDQCPCKATRVVLNPILVPRFPLAGTRLFNMRQRGRVPKAVARTAETLFFVFFLLYHGILSLL